MADVNGKENEGSQNGSKKEEVDQKEVVKKAKKVPKPAKKALKVKVQLKQKKRLRKYSLDDFIPSEGKVPTRRLIAQTPVPVISHVLCPYVGEHTYGLQSITTIHNWDEVL